MYPTPSTLETRLVKLIQSSDSVPVLEPGVRIDFAFSPPEDAARVASLLR